MSRSLNRVKRHLATLGLEVEVLHLTTPTTTAREAADAMSCEVNQIVKSIVFAGMTSGEALVFLTSGGRRVDESRASLLAGEPLGKADAKFIREKTGFAIGGVSPFGHINPLRIFLDRHLCDFGTIWAAAGTPHHMFEIETSVLIAKSGATVADFSA